MESWGRWGKGGRWLRKSKSNQEVAFFISSVLRKTTLGSKKILRFRYFTQLIASDFQGSHLIPKSLVKTALWFNLAILFSLAYFLMMNHGVKFSLGKHAASIWSGISEVGCIQDTVCHDMLFFLKNLYWQ